MKILVEVDNETLKLSEHNAVTGEVRIRVGSLCFPHAKWDDFVLVVLAWWLQAMLDMETSESDCFELTFMDGPFKVRGTRLDETQLNVEFVENTERGERSIVTAIGDLVSFRDSLLRAAQDTVRSVDRNRWHPTDIDNLRHTLGLAKARWTRGKGTKKWIVS